MDIHCLKILQINQSVYQSEMCIQ